MNGEVDAQDNWIDASIKSPKVSGMYWVYTDYVDQPFRLGLFCGPPNSLYWCLDTDDKILFWQPTIPPKLKPKK